ncbi:MAG TPA: FG-GAP-like repeat-containing protein [Flavobacteriales bacterium]|nr:FG-GAP-like repeat-containing protein [Flavobacteriales bacterium]
MRLIAYAALPVLLFSSLSATAQDDCSTALTIGLGTHTSPTLTGTPSAIQCIGGQSGSAGRWYRFTAPADMSITVSSYVPIYPNVDTRLNVFAGDCGALTCVGGDDDTGPGYSSIFTFNATQGTTYTLVWDSYWTANGFNFTVLETVVPPAPENMVLFTNTTVPGTSGIQGAVDMNDDGKDDLVSPGFASFNVGFQGAAGAYSVVNFPTTNAVNTASWSFAVGDWDSNGHRDLLYGGGSGATFMTANSDGSAYTQWSPTQYIFSQRTNFVDLNNDGHLDAFVCHDVDANVSFMNNGAGSLTHTQGPYGLTCGNYGSIFTDIDNDCDMDLFVAKCGCDPTDLLMLNNGTGTFNNVAPGLGLADGHQSWSSAWGDFDNDGDMDVLIGASSGIVHKLMRNNGDGTFTNVTVGSGFDTFTGQSIEWTAHDFNNDGFIDVLGGGALHYNNGDWTFSPDVTAPGNHAIGDLNNDGFLDIARGGGYYRNEGNDNNWIRLNLQGTISNRDGIGARVIITSALGSQIRDIRSGDGFRYMSFIGAHFGLDHDTEVQDVVIRWPNCTEEIIKNPAINTVHTIVQGTFTGVDEQIAAPFSVQPNPAIDVLAFSGADANAAYQVLDASGRTVMSGRAAGGRLNVQALSPGAYVLRLAKPDGFSTARFVKE